MCPPLSYLFLNLLMETCRGKIVGDGNGIPLQYSCLENPMDRGAWWAAVHGVAQSQTWIQQLSMHALEKEMATHSSILTWRIPGMEEPGGLPSVGSHRVRHDWSNLTAAAERIVYNEPPWCITQNQWLSVPCQSLFHQDPTTSPDYSFTNSCYLIFLSLFWYKNRI